MYNSSYNDKKAAQAAAYLLSRAGNQMDFYILTKLLYLAERESLLKWGRDFFGGELVSMPYGPTHSNIYDDAKYQLTDTEWQTYISPKSDNLVDLKTDINIDDLTELSNRELTLLDELLIRHGKKSFSEMKRYVHGLDEYEETQSSSEIHRDDILKNAGATEQQLSNARSLSTALEMLTSNPCH